MALTRAVGYPVIPVMRYLAAVLCFLAGATVFLSAERSRIELRDGSELSAEVLQEKPDRVIVDLGFELLSIPREAIHRITAEQATPATGFTEGSIYRVGSDGVEASVTELAQRNGEAVVLIETAAGLGSGFIIHPAGYLVTNDHVIAGEYEISVTVFEQEDSGLQRKVYENVRLVATNADLDLALLKIDTEDDRTFPTVPVGDSGQLSSGDPVFAIGSPLGLDRSVSQGIISVPNRPLGGRLYIQTTAEISPGNSGGPLFNRRGEVVGVTNMKVVGMGAEGLAFAIPARALRNFLDNRDAFAFDPRNPNAGFRYNAPPRNNDETP